MLGLTRMQIYTVLSEAEVNADNMISYSNFVPRAVGLIRSMLSFESLDRISHTHGTKDEEKFYAVLDEAYAGTETLGLPDFMQRLEQSSLLDSKELDACHRMLGTTYAAEELPRMYLVSTEALNLYTHTLMEELLPDLDSYLGLACWIAKSWTPVIACWGQPTQPKSYP
eukprot:g13516.t1